MESRKTLMQAVEQGNLDVGRQLQALQDDVESDPASVRPIPPSLIKRIIRLRRMAQLNRAKDGERDV